MKDIASFIALNRFGLGAAPGEDRHIATDPRGWIKTQIVRKQETPAVLGTYRSSESIMAEIHNARLEGPEKLRPTTRELYRAAFNAETIDRARHMITTDKPFAERMVLFWSNHFTVSRTRGIMGPAIPAYEREVIRPHVFGRFDEMLKAVSRHICMLTYLDNIISIGPNSRAGQRRRQRNANAKTLNENLAREILELHTLGVNGGYTQNDIIELAKAISGWSHGGLRPGRNRRQNQNQNQNNSMMPAPAPRGDTRPVFGGYEFREQFHEPGPKTILGKTYRENGAEEGLAVLHDLARHPSTAKFIATKLVRHFVSDNPPAAAVEKIAAVFRSTDGDLAEVSRAVLDLPEVWSNPLPKIKNHYELVISTHRATGNTFARPRDILMPLREMGQMPFFAQSPQGWDDTAKSWISPEALMRRIEWLRRYAAQLPSTLYPSQVLENAIGPVAREATRTWTERAPSGDAAIAMILASPEFQRR